MEAEDESNAARNEKLKAEETKNPKPNKEKMREASPLPEAAAKIEYVQYPSECNSQHEPAKMDVEEESEAARNESLKAAKISLAEAAAKINPLHLEAYLENSSHWFPGSDLFQFVDYLGRAFSRVSSVQYPWPTMDKLIDLIDLPISHIPQDVYKTSADWIKQVPTDTVCAFVLWSFGFIRAHLEGTPHGPKSLMGVYVALAMVLRQKRIALLIILPFFRDYAFYQAEFMVPVRVWMMAQVSQVDICLAMYSWAQNLLPLVGNNHKCSPQTVDLILQLVEKILSHPDARTILVKDAFQNGEARLITPPLFEILLQRTFPSSFAIAEDTKRFQAIYPLLKELALAGAPRREAMKNVAQQIFAFSLKLAGEEGNPVLAKEATEIAIWSVTENVDCFNHWDDVYNNNLQASVALLKKLVDEWKDHSLKLSSSRSDALTLHRTMKSFMLKNQKSFTEGGANASLYKEADAYIEKISGSLTRGSCFRKSIAITAVCLLAVATTKLMNLVGSFDLHEYVNAITTTLNN